MGDKVDFSKARDLSGLAPDPIDRAIATVAEDTDTVITIRAKNGSANLNIDVKNAIPGQLWTAAEMLRLVGNQIFASGQPLSTDADDRTH